MPAPLRIAITCYPTFGGSGVIATEIGRTLARRGHRVHFISYDVPARLEHFEDNVVFHEVSVRDYPVLNEVPYPLALASKMVEVSRFEGLDLLHVHYAVPHATSAYLARQILHAAGDAAPRIITTLHGTDTTLVGSDPSLLPITRFSVIESDGVTVPSAFLREATYTELRVPRTVPIEVIPNFVDTDRFCPTDEPHPLRVIHVSNFRPVKRVDDVVRVFAEVHRAVPTATLVLVGDGPERFRIEGMVREAGLASQVTFLGKQGTFLEVLQRSDVFLLPSETESFGLAALEALACGVPVVASDVGGVPEVVAAGELGFLAPVGDVAAMAAATIRLLTDRALHAEMSRAARARALERWREAPMVDRYEDYYRRVLARDRSVVNPALTSSSR